MTDEQMISVLLADDHPVVREGIRGMLASQADLEVVGQASSGPEAVKFVAQKHPDVVLMDLRMPGGDGVDATREIVAGYPGTRVLVLTTYETDDDILRAVEAGASGYLLKDIDPQTLAGAVRSAAVGGTSLSPSAAAALMNRMQGKTTATPKLSEQETKVLQLVADGSTNAEVAARMFISETTVKTYLSRTYEKLGVTDRMSAVRLGMKYGLLDRQ